MRSWPVVIAALLLLPATAIIAFASLPLAPASVIVVCALAAHLVLLGQGSRPTATLLVLTALVAVQAVVTGLFVVLPSTLLVLGGLFGAAARGRRPAAYAVAVAGPIAAAVRYAIDPNVVGSGFGPQPWLLALLLLAGSAVAVALGLLRRADLRTIELTAARLALEERDRENSEARAVADERARIAFDLHDVLAHSLTVILGQARVARFTDDSDAALRVIEDTARDSLRDLRGTLRVLHDPDAGADVRPAPGLAGLPGLADRMRGLGLVVDHRSQGVPHSLGAAAELALHRFVQEALTNALRHGDGPVDWQERWEDDRIVITLRNAVPAVARPSPGAGRGLTGMRERLAAVSGVLDVDRADGFAVTATVPFRDQGEARA